MRRKNIILVIALALALMASVAWNQVSTASAQDVQQEGIVVAYLSGQSITILDKNGNQIEFAIDPALKILPPDAAKSLKVGSFVSIIAPASLSKGKQIAVGIVVKPDVPDGLKVLAMSATPQVKNMPESTEAAATDAAKELVASATPQVKNTPENTQTVATEPSKDSLRTTTTPMVTSTDKSKTTSTPKTNGLIEWLTSLLRQLLGS